MAVPNPFNRADYLLAAHTHRQLPPDGGREVAFAGRSNAGKSSALNALCGRNALARVSKTPGRTQQLVYFGLPPHEGKYLVDLPGYGYAKVPQDLQAHWQAFLDGYFGSRMALEHFGAGLNSLQTLQHFEPALLKIDPQFMDDLAKSTDSQGRVREIAKQASSRGIRTVAERVVDAASMTMLFSAGVDYVQGDFLAPAGPDMTYDFS